MLFIEFYKSLVRDFLAQKRNILKIFFFFSDKKLYLKVLN